MVSSVVSCTHDNFGSNNNTSGKFKQSVINLNHALLCF